MSTTLYRLGHWAVRRRRLVVVLWLVGLLLAGATAAALQREVQSRLIESLDYLEARKPEVVLDIGAGTGHASALMKKRWPKAQVIALDVAEDKLAAALLLRAGWPALAAEGRPLMLARPARC